MKSTVHKQNEPVPIKRYRPICRRFSRPGLCSCRISCFFLIFLPLSPAFADLIGYQNGEIKTLEYVIQTHHQVFNSTKTDLPNSSTESVKPVQESWSWKQILLDISQEKILDKTTNSQERPTDFSQADFISFYEKGTLTQIDYAKKRVTLNSTDPINLDMTFPIVFIGRIFRGKLISELMQAAQERKWAKEENGETIIQFDPSYFRNSVLFQFNKAKQLERIAQTGLRVHHYLFDAGEWKCEWSKAPGRKFEYVSYWLSTLGDGKQIINHYEEWVKEIKVNPAIAPDLFTVQTPEGYPVYDLRKLLTPPAVGAPISPAAASQKTGK